RKSLGFFAIYLFFRAKEFASKAKRRRVTVISEALATSSRAQSLVLPSRDAPPPTAASSHCHPRTTTGACPEKHRPPSCLTARIPSAHRGWLPNPCAFRR